jgi:hypothetical protein
MITLRVAAAPSLGRLALLWASYRAAWRSWWAHYMVEAKRDWLDNQW